MTTNQTIDGVLVSRELLRRVSNPYAPKGQELARAELRALLDAPASASDGVNWKAVANEQMGIIQALKSDNAKLADDRTRLSAELETLRPAYKSVLAQLDAAQPQGEHTAVGFLERMLKGSGDDRLEAWQGEMAMLLEHIAEQPAPVAVQSLEIVGRQCFPSEAMKAVQGYRKEPWVDGDAGQVPSIPGFYRVEPLVRLSDVLRLVAISR
ncbi:hypothetical protein EXW72_08560 [Pseudomonas sp. BCA14]|uniref:hypothetical protein n=1 Tax=unclassified Pseudomonas TaxID=196821 RepID=UPI00106E423B|nr:MULTISPECIES: hypothetical protein [unclassified Pseudomonas]TFF13685.1 hypothetical protein EXW70_03930 [Pseudomonas sp. JMN1]TFF15632.1 hypothetical protein EXW71_05110 [Pseudomonas sp. BCA17]TFF32039.1 hypothetical protein EXW72_08560 [Pseudomonas sp. BCA14]TFF32992.1 hypothetical protein EXW73_04360 [Pseudomonas sp. BCA13]